MLILGLIFLALAMLFGGSITHALLPHDHVAGGFWETFHGALRTFEEFLLIICWLVTAGVCFFIFYSSVAERRFVLLRERVHVHSAPDCLRNGTEQYRKFR